MAPLPDGPARPAGCRRSPLPSRSVVLPQTRRGRSQGSGGGRCTPRVLGAASRVGRPGPTRPALRVRRWGLTPSSGRRFRHLASRGVGRSGSRAVRRAHPPPARAAHTSRTDGAVAVSAPRDAPGLCARLLRGVRPLPSTATAPSTTAMRVPRCRSAACGACPGPSVLDTTERGHSPAASATPPRHSRSRGPGEADGPPVRSLTRRRWAPSQAGAGAPHAGPRLPCSSAKPARRKPPCPTPRRS